MDGRRPRRNSTSYYPNISAEYPNINAAFYSMDEDGNVLWLGVKLGECWKTDMQVAIDNSNRREDASFTIRVGKTGTTQPYQQPIPMNFAKCYKNLFKESITLEGPTGKTWTTILQDFHNVVRFGKGWRQLSLENHLQEGYQLLFTLVGRFRFLVQFFDHLGKRCASYPPLPVAQPGSLPVAQPETQRQPGFQQAVDGGQASHRYGSEGQTSAAVPLMGTTPNSAIPLNFDQDNVILRQSGPELSPESRSPHGNMRELEEHTFGAWSGSEDMEIEDEFEENEELDEAQNDILRGSDTDDEVPIYHPPATMQPLRKPEHNIPTSNELSRGKQPKFHSPDNRAHSPQIQDHNNSSSGDELPFLHNPEMQKKSVRAKRPSAVAPPVASSHEAGGSSGSSPAMRVMQQQGCTRFSQIVLKCERHDVSEQERRVVVEAARRFVSASENYEKFFVVMRDEQVYHTFHLAIPEKILEATGTERANKVEVCLLDREQALYKTYWTRQNFCDTPLLDRDAWAKFAVDHTLEEGDVCVFQLLQSKPAVSMPAFFFCVHIFRVVDTPVGQLNFSGAIDSE